MNLPELNVLDVKSFVDGLYRVVSRSFVAGFIVKNGKVVDCAPILRSKINYWITVAELVK